MAQHGIHIMHYAIMHWLAICARVDCCVIARQNTALSPPCTARRGGCVGGAVAGVMNLFVLQIISITRPQIGDFLMGVGGQWSSNTLYRDFTALQCLMKIHLLVMARGSRWLDEG